MSRRRTCFAIVFASQFALSSCALSHLHSTADDDVAIDAGEPVSEASAPLCRFDAPADADAPVMAGIRGHSLFFLRGAGRTENVYEFGAPDDAFITAQVVVRGDFIAALMSWSVPYEPANYELVLMNRKAQTRYVKRLKEKDANATPAMLVADIPLRLNDQGMLALSMFPWGSSSQAWLIDAQGNERIVVDATPITEPERDGAQPVAFRISQADNKYVLGWIAPGASSAQQVSLPRSYDGFQEYGARLLDDRLVYLSTRDGAPVLVLERPGDSHVFALPRNDGTNYRILDITPEAVLLHHAKKLDDQPLDAAQFVRVLLEGGSVRNVQLPTQGALKPASEIYSVDGPRLDADGALLAGLRDASGAALYRTRDAEHWQRVGDSMGGLRQVYFLRHEHTYLISGEPWQDWLGPMPVEDGKADHGGSVFQVVDGKGHVQVLDNVAQTSVFYDAQLSADGRCALYGPKDAQVPSVLDVERGKSFTPFGEDLPSYHALTWVE